MNNNEWISVRDRVPDSFRWVEIKYQTKYSHKVGTLYGWYCNNMWSQTILDCGEPYNILYWRELDLNNLKSF